MVNRPKYDSSCPPSRLSVEELEIILECLSKQFGFGYSSLKAVCRLQAKLSIMEETAKNLSYHTQYHQEALNIIRSNAQILNRYP